MHTRRVVLIGSAASLCAGRARAAAPFTAAVEDDAAAGRKVLVLRHNAGRPPLEARVAPAAGGNLFSLKVGDDELLVPPGKPGDFSRAGTPILFPTPNRVRDAAFTFEGRRFEFVANNGKNFIHGLVRQRPWQAAEPRASASGASARVWIDWDEAQPDWARFPLPHRLEVTYTLRRDGIRIAYAVQNRGEGRLPFGFALHPWFRVPGDRKDVLLQVPARQRMEAEDKLPTGKLLPVSGPYDLREPTPLEGLDLDDVYLVAGAPSFEWRDRGLEVTLAGSREFTHVVVYTPPGKPFFCVENQTCSTDAHNLWGKGLKKESNLQIVAAGATARGHVDWTVRRTRAA